MTRKSHYQMHFCLTVQNQQRKCLICQSISIYSSVGLSTVFISIHLNPGRRFYVRPGPQGSAGRQSSTKKCLLSWRRLGLSGRPGCTSLPYVTVREGQGGEVKERHKYKKLVLTTRGPTHKTPVNLLKCL